MLVSAKDDSDERTEQWRGTDRRCWVTDRIWGGGGGKS